MIVIQRDAAYEQGDGVADKPRPMIGSVTPYLCVRNARGAIEFYRRAFDAVETMRLEDERQRVSHCELAIGDGRIYLADEFPEQGIVGPQTLGGTPVLIDLDVNDVEGWVERALCLGATLVRPLELPETGLQTGKLQDPYGHIWLLSRFAGTALDEQVE
jgi:PhnB protein